MLASHIVKTRCCSVNMTPGHVLRACSLAASTILRSTHQVEEVRDQMEEAGHWEHALKVTPGLEFRPFVPLCFHLWRSEQPLPHDPAATIQDYGRKSPTLWAQTRPSHPRSCFYLFCHSGAAKLTHILTFLGWAKGDGTGEMSAWDDNIMRLGSKMKRGCFGCSIPSPILLYIHLCITRV